MKSMFLPTEDNARCQTFRAIHCKRAGNSAATVSTITHILQHEATKTVALREAVMAPSKSRASLILFILLVCTPAYLRQSVKSAQSTESLPLSSRSS